MPVGIHLGLRRRKKSSGGTPGPVTDAAITAIRAEGWSLDFTAPPTFDPVGAPRYAVLDRQGFDMSGGTTTVRELLVLTSRVRQPYPAQTSLDASRVALADYVYATDALVGGSTPVNNAAEFSPKPIVRWALADRRTVGNSLRLELVAAHRNARSREQVACVRFVATDGTLTVSQIVSASSILGATNDRFPVVGYAVNLDISTLAEGQVTVNAEVYPWIGGAASVAKSSDSPPGTRTFCPQVFRKATSRPVLYAYVDTSGNDTTGVASTNTATASAAPCLTIAGALARIRAADGGTITDGHVVRLKAGTQAIGSAANVTHSSVSELVIEADPAAGSTPVINLAANWATRHLYLRLRGITVSRTLNTAQITCNFLTVENCIFANAGAGFTPNGGTSVFRWEGCTLTGVSSAMMGPGTNPTHQLVRGVTTDAPTGIDPFCVLGNDFLNAAVTAAIAAQEGGYVGFNRFKGQTGPAYQTGNLGNVDGFAAIQNLIEVTATTLAILSMRLSGDANVGNVTHLVCHHNTMTGFSAVGRTNALYADTAGTNRTHRLASFVGNIHVQINTKHDVFSLTPANVNAWAYLYGVGCRGEFSQFQDAGGTLAGGYRPFAQDYPGLNASIGTSASLRNDPLFSNYQGTVSASVAGAGGGDYNLQSGSPAIGRVTSPVLAFDLAGVARSATASAAGAYERPI